MRWLPDLALASSISVVSFLVACNDLVEDVPTDVCASGKRWAGEKTGSEEMYPGRDCVSCHQDNEGPEFLAAGTVYGRYDYDGAFTTNNDCFGIEGATVTITAGDGQVFRTRTNRAGNFFFEGRESSLVKPFEAEIEYRLPDGSRSRQTMTSSPSYGGCAHCHSPAAVTTPGACPGDILDSSQAIRVTPLFTGPVPDGTDMPVTIPGCEVAP